MVMISNKRIIDNSARITIPSELAKLMNLEKGKDTVYWSVEDGKAILRKVTKPYFGIDIEQEMIEKNLLDYERMNCGEQSYDDLPEDQRRKLAIEMYLSEHPDAGTP